MIHINELTSLLLLSSCNKQQLLKRTVLPSTKNFKKAFTINIYYISKENSTEGSFHYKTYIIIINWEKTCKTQNYLHKTKM